MQMCKSRQRGISNQEQMDQFAVVGQDWVRRDLGRSACCIADPQSQDSSRIGSLHRRYGGQRTVHRPLIVSVDGLPPRRPAKNEQRDHRSTDHTNPSCAPTDRSARASTRGFQSFSRRTVDDGDETAQQQHAEDARTIPRNRGNPSRPVATEGRGRSPRRSRGRHPRSRTRCTHPETSARAFPHRRRSPRGLP